MSESTENEQDVKHIRKQLNGMVASSAPDKTIVVEVERRKPHPLYGKVVKHTKKFYAHDANNEAVPGDNVTVEETRPISKLKRWRLVSINRRSEMPE